jgi:hypothetical protein
MVAPYIMSAPLTDSVYNTNDSINCITIYLPEVSYANNIVIPVKNEN